MARRVSKLQIGNIMEGRILSFDRLKGYGFIRTSTDKDILFSSYSMPKNVWKKISVGDYVEFVVEKGGGAGNSVVAKHTTIIKKMPRQLSIVLPNHEELEVRHIYKFGRNSLLKDGYGKIYPDYQAESFDYVFVRTSDRTFTFNQYGSPIILDGEVNVKTFYEKLVDLLVKYDIRRDYEAKSF